MKLHHNSHLPPAAPRTGRIANCFTTAAVLISGFIAPLTSEASYYYPPRKDTAGLPPLLLLGGIDKILKPEMKPPEVQTKKSNTQTVAAGDYVVVTGFSPTNGEPIGTCYGVDVSKVTESAVEFYIETAVMGQIQRDSVVKIVRFGQQRDFYGFMVTAEKGDRAGTVKMTFDCNGC